jgi:hypothetical protein
VKETFSGDKDETKLSLIRHRISSIVKSENFSSMPMLSRRKSSLIIETFIRSSQMLSSREKRCFKKSSMRSLMEYLEYHKK